MPKVKKTVKTAETTQTEQGATSALSNTNISDTVVIGLNWPQSVVFEITDNSGGTVKLELNGNGSPLKGKMQGILPTGGAYGLTFNVKREYWDALVEQRLAYPPFSNWLKLGLIWAHDSKADAEAETANCVGIKNGVEPIDPKKTITKEAAF